MVDNIKLNIILYYADYLAIRNSSRQVTDNCKYYYIEEAPINLAYLCNSQPFYDEHDKYYIQACNEIQMIENKVGLDGARKFVNNICNVKMMGCIDAKTMLSEVHLFSTRIDRSTAFKDYLRWLNTQYYTHLQTDDKGDWVRVRCSRYVAHSEFGTEYKPKVCYERKHKKYEKQTQNA